MRKTKQRAKPGPKPKYPWARWLGKSAGDSYRLAKGVHYKCQTHAFAIQLRKAAAALGISVSVYIANDVVTVTNRGPV